MTVRIVEHVRLRREIEPIRAADVFRHQAPALSEMLVPLHCIRIGDARGKGSPARARCDPVVEPLDRGNLIRRKLKCRRTLPILSVGILLDLGLLTTEPGLPDLMLIPREDDILSRINNRLISCRGHHSLLSEGYSHGGQGRSRIGQLR